MFAVFQKGFRDNRRTIFWLSFGLALYALMVVSFYPSLAEQQDELNELIDSYPDGMLALFYGDTESENIDLTEPGGFVQSQFATWMVLIIGGILIGQVFNAFTNAERSGTMDIMLSLPVSRRSLLLGRILNSMLSLLLVLTACFLAFVVTTFIWEEFDIPIVDLGLAIYGAFFIIMTGVSLTYALAVSLPSRWKFAGVIAYLFFIGSYIIYGLMLSSPDFEAARPFFIYHYYSARDIVVNGVSLSDWGILSTISVAFLAIAYWRIEEKDMGV